MPDSEILLSLGQPCGQVCHQSLTKHFQKETENPSHWAMTNTIPHRYGIGNFARFLRRDTSVKTYLLTLKLKLAKLNIGWRCYTYRPLVAVTGTCPGPSQRIDGPLVVQLDVGGS